MKLTIFNCSPKLGKNNTEVLLDKFIEGFMSQAENKVEVYKLNKLESIEEATKLFEKAESVLVAFPLYCYAMPGGVKEFIEALEPLAGKCKGKKVAFLVQYGFLEAIHARPIEKYLTKLARILDCHYLGTIIKGGCDNLSNSPESRYKKIAKDIYNIGVTLGKNEEFDQSELDQFSQPEFQKRQSILIMKIVVKLINKFYWGGIMKKNGVSIEDSYAKPYEL